MREAVRGDLERARSRNPSIFATAPEPEPDAVVHQSEPEPEPEAVVQAPEPVAVKPEIEPEPVAEPEPAVEEPPARKRFRLLFWRA